MDRSLARFLDVVTVPLFSRRAAAARDGGVVRLCGVRGAAAAAPADQAARLCVACAWSPVDAIAALRRERGSVSSARSHPRIPCLLHTTLLADLLKFSNASTVREVYHYTSYFLAAGVPLTLLFGGPVSTVVDLALGAVIPLHFHIGMRSVVVDYVHDVSTQKLVLAALAGVTVLTAVGLTKFNLTDEGITAAVKDLWVHQEAPPAEPAPKKSKY
jgi:succinate dehydrogenase hydrophobic anchor subunit